MAVIKAVNYREKARQLRETATSVPSPILRDQLASLAAQYDNVATTLERMLAP
jgi:hypothetical protein